MCEKVTTETPHAERAAEQLEIGSRLRARVSPERWRHTLSVAETAYRLAGALGWGLAERERALLAALLHDVAKELPRAELRELAGQWLGRTAAESFPRLLHAAAGARLAKREFEISDKDVLEAIALHPTGSAEPSALADLLFVADYLEPTRRQLDGDDRALLESALSGAVELPTLFCRVLGKKLAGILSGGLRLHPRSVAAWNARCAGRG